MKLESSEIVIDSSAQSSKSFGIRDQDMGVILGILRSKLYSDPIGSICREYYSNAVDAHTAAGRPEVPVDVHLPTTWLAEYKIRDYGTGMSPDLVDEIFTNYGASTKRDSNDQIGGFGIGSKSAWSYSDTFTIDTIYQGKRYVYAAVIDDSQRGKVFLMSEEPSTERSGTSIVIPVRRGDYEDFARSTYFYTSFFDPRPNILGKSSHTWTEPSFTYKGDRWGLLNNRGSSLALVGSIPYPLSLSPLGGVDNKIKTLFNAGVLLKFNIGELTLSASRESIHYDDKSKKLIVDRFMSTIEELTKQLEPLVASASDLWEASLSYYNNHQLLNSYLPGQVFKWQGEPIKTYYEVDNDLQVSQFLKDPNTGNIKVINRKDVVIKPAKNTVLYVSDLDSDVKKDRVRTLLDESPKLNIIIVSRRKGPLLLSDTTKCPLGVLGAKLLSEVTPTRVPRVKVVKEAKTQEVKEVKRKPKNMVEGFSFPSVQRRTDNKGMYQHMEPVYLDPENDGGTYVVVKGGAVTAGILETNGYKGSVGFHSNFDCDSYLRNVMGFLGLDKIYAFREGTEVGPNWIRLDEHLTKTIEDRLAAKDPVLVNLGSLTYTFSQEMGVDYLVSHSSELAKDSLLRKYIETSKEVGDFIDKSTPRGILDVIRLYVSIEKLDDLGKDMQDLSIACESRYPLIPGVSKAFYSHYQVEYGPAVVQYVNICDWAHRPNLKGEISE